MATLFGLFPFLKTLFADGGYRLASIRLMLRKLCNPA
jgi:hypothetical protein